MRATRAIYCLFVLATGAQARPTEHALDVFTGNGLGNPFGLSADAAGNLYTSVGIASGFYGGILRVSPPANGFGEWVPQLLYSFQCGTDGGVPRGGVLAAANGHVYATTYSCGSNNLGTVVELTPPARIGAIWSEQVIFRFNYTGPAQLAYGAAPQAGLIEDSVGNLYTTTTEGGNGCGVVLELSPPGAVGGAWAATVLHSFAGAAQDGDGCSSEATPVMDSAGNLYITTFAGGKSNYGAIIRLAPAAGGGWTETVLYSFTGGADGEYPIGPVSIGPHGDLLAAAYGGGAFGKGTLVRLAPPEPGTTAWRAQILYAFGQNGASDGAAPYGGVLIDARGRLFTTTAQGGANGKGTIVQLLPPRPGRAGWTEKVLYDFGGWPGLNSPYSGLIADAAGTLYVSPYEGGADQFYGGVAAFTGTGFLVPKRK